LAAVALAGVTFVVFLPSLRCQFVNFDDPQYVSKNPQVKGGLSGEGVYWAFTTYHAANWHPLTWLSLQLDATLWGGAKPFGFHLTNVLLHAANAALLFLALRALTGAYWRSAAVALLFALHPLRVESVAWVAERKDVLSTLFGLLALWAYAGYARSPSVWRYLLVAAPFGLSLAAKPMLVTLPCLLLVLDWWPLARLREGFGWFKPVVEKVSLFALAAASCVVTALAQAKGQAVMSLEVYPPAARLGNAAIAYWAYLAKTVWPTGLAIYYPHPGSELAVADAAGATIVLAAVTAGAVALRRRAPYLLAGWLWYVGTLVPVIGLVQVGGQAYADRYTYFPQIGILLAVCWGAADLARARPRLAPAAAVAAALVLAALTWSQQAVWSDSLTLWQHNHETTRPCLTSLINLGEALEEKGRYPEATVHFRDAYRINPDDLQACYDLGNALHKQGKLDDAARLLERASGIDPASAASHILLGDILSKMERWDEAARRYEKGLDLAPSAGAYCNLGLAHVRRNRLDSAEGCYRAALRLQADSADAHSGLGNVLVLRKKPREGIAELREAVRCAPRSGPAHNNLGWALEDQGDRAGAAACYEEAVRLSPELTVGQANLGRIRLWQRRPAEAVGCFERAVAKEPRSAEYRAALADAYAAAGRFPDAAASAGRARELAAASGRAALARQIEGRLRRYERGEPAPEGTP
jgi:tetratricopeptide (TPR) repeat protein